MSKQMKMMSRLFLLLIILAALAFFFGQMAWEGVATAAPDIPTAAPPHAPIWSAPQLVVTESAVEPKVAANRQEGSQDVLIAFNRRLGEGGNNDPYYRRSTNNGQTWTTAAPIHNSPTLASNSVEVDVVFSGNGVAHALWVENRALAYAPESRWPTNNTSNLPTLISNPVIPPGAASPLLVATGESILDVIWSEGDGVNPNIYHARSTNGGVSWPIKGIIRSTPPESRVPSLAVSPTDDNRLYAVWEEQVAGAVVTSTAVIMFAQGTVSGGSVSWSNPIVISTNAGDNVAFEQPEIIANSQGLHVTYSYHDLANEVQLVYYVKCGFNCTQASNWSGLTNVGGQFVEVNGTLPFYVISNMVTYGYCVQVYYHGVKLDLLQENEQIWGVNNCDNWSGGGVDEVTDPVTTRAVSPNMDVGAGGWIYMVYSEVLASDLLQTHFVSSQDDDTIIVPFAGVFLPIIFRN